MVIIIINNWHFVYNLQTTEHLTLFYLHLVGWRDAGRHLWWLWPETRISSWFKFSHHLGTIFTVYIHSPASIFFRLLI